MPDLNKLLSLLLTSKINFVVVGGFAAVLWMTPQKLSFLEYPTDISSIKNLYLQTDLGILDVLGFVSGIGEFDEVNKNSITIELFGEPCRMLSLEALIVAKKTMGSTRDLMTARELELIAEKSK
jgi:hypothetical protein